MVNERGEDGSLVLDQVVDLTQHTTPQNRLYVDRNHVAASWHAGSRAGHLLYSTRHFDVARSTAYTNVDLDPSKDWMTAAPRQKGYFYLSFMS